MSYPANKQVKTSLMFPDSFSLAASGSTGWGKALHTVPVSGCRVHLPTGEKLHTAACVGREAPDRAPSPSDLVSRRCGASDSYSNAQIVHRRSRKNAPVSLVLPVQKLDVIPSKTTSLVWSQAQLLLAPRFQALCYRNPLPVHPNLHKQGEDKISGSSKPLPRFHLSSNNLPTWLRCSVHKHEAVLHPVVKLLLFDRKIRMTFSFFLQFLPEAIFQCPRCGANRLCPRPLQSSPGLSSTPWTHSCPWHRPGKSLNTTLSAFISPGQYGAGSLNSQTFVLNDHVFFS